MKKNRRYHNVSVTCLFLMRMRDRDDPNNVPIGREDCLAFFTFELRLHLDDDNYLEPTYFNITSFQIADPDLFN